MVEILALSALILANAVILACNVVIYRDTKRRSDKRFEADMAKIRGRVRERVQNG